MRSCSTGGEKISHFKSYVNVFVMDNGAVVFYSLGFK